MNKCLIGLIGFISLSGLEILGCQSSAEREPLCPAELTEIQTVQWENESMSEPVDVAQASKQATLAIDDTNAMSVPITLEQVRAAALANNLNLKVDLMDPDISLKTLQAEQAKFEASVTGDVDTGYTEALGSGAVSKDWYTEMGVVKPLATGGRVIASMPMGDSDPGGLASASASVTVMQSLLRGAGTGINTQSIRIAEYHWQSVSAQTKLRAINLLANADIAYWRLYAAQMDLALTHEQYKLAQDQLDHARKKVRAGASARIEIVRAEAGLSSRLESVINAETTVEYYARNLKAIMNRPDLPIDSSINLTLVTEPHPLGLTLDEQSLFALAVKRRMDMKMVELSMQEDELNVAAARNAVLPDVTLSYSYTARTQGPSVRDAMEGFSGQTYDDHALGLSVVIPVGNQAAKARLRRAKLSQLQGKLLKKALSQEIQQEVVEAAAQLDRNWRRILAAEQGVIAAQRDYDVDQSQFKLGRRNSTDVLYSAARLGSAESSRIQAFVDYEIAQINLARVTGTLLGRDCIQLASSESLVP